MRGIRLRIIRSHVEPEELLLVRVRGEEKDRIEGERERERRSSIHPIYAVLNDREREVQSAAVNYPFGRRRV